MTGQETVLLLLAAVLVVVAGVFSSADAALANVSKVRAEELVAERRAGATRLLTIAEDPARYLNTALFLRMFCEVLATVLVAEVVLPLFDSRWVGVLLAAGVMVVLQFVVIGVGPRPRRPPPPPPHARSGAYVYGSARRQVDESGVGGAERHEGGVGGGGGLGRGGHDARTRAFATLGGLGALGGPLLPRIHQIEPQTGRQGGHLT